MIKRRSKRDISDVVVETTVEEIPIPDNKKETVEEKKEPETLGSKKVKIDPDKSEEDDLVIDYMKESFSDKEASKRTKENTDKPTPNAAFEKDVKEIKEEISRSEESRSKTMSGEGILKIATFIVNAFSGGLGVLLNFIARDNRVGVYTLPVETKRELSEQLALVLIKYQVKFKIEFLFLLTLIIAYIGPVGGAIKHRKQVHNGNVPIRKKGGQEKPKQEFKQEFISEESEKKQEPLIEDAPEENKTLRVKPPRRSNRKKATL